MTLLTTIGIAFAIGIILFTLGMIKEKKIIKYSGIAIILLVGIFIVMFFVYSVQSENEELRLKMGGTLTQNDMLPIPDRIIFKDENSVYYVITPGDKVFDPVYTEISNRVDMIKPTDNLSDEEIKSIKNKEMFIELDYNTKSKNKIFPLEEDYIGMINMKDEGGTITKKGLIDKEDLIKKVKQSVKKVKSYSFEKSETYTSTKYFDSVPEGLNFKEKTFGVYQLVIDNQQLFNDIYNKIEFSTSIKIPEIDFSEKNVVMTISYYGIDKIEENIGNLKYYFKNSNNTYKVSMLIVNKLVNINCIYCNLDYSSTYDNVNNMNNTINTYTTVKGIVENITDNGFEISYEKNNVTNTIILNEKTEIKEYIGNANKNLEDIKIGDSVYIEGNIIETESKIETVEATKIQFYKKEDLKKFIEENFKDGYRIDGYSIINTNINSSGEGYIIVELALDNFIYPIKLNVNSKTETYLGMGRHIENNYGYILHEMCDITLENKIKDIDNMTGYVKMIEYIAD